MGGGGDPHSARKDLGNTDESMMPPQIRVYIHSARPGQKDYALINKVNDVSAG